VEVYKLSGITHIHVIKNANKIRRVKGFLALSRWYQSVRAILCILNSGVCTNVGRQVARPTKFFMVVPEICVLLLCILVYLPSASWNFEVAPRFCSKSVHCSSNLGAIAVIYIL